MTQVVNESAKGRTPFCQVGVDETNASEPLTTCRKTLDAIETSCADINWDQLGGSLPTAQAVTGKKAA